MDKAELIGLLKNNVTQFNLFRKENPSVVPDLSGADLAGSNIAQADLARANLAGAFLRGASLKGANLSFAVLERADLREADLTDAVMHRAQFQGANLLGARVGGFEGNGRLCLNIACFQGVSWDREQIEEMLRIINQNERWTIRYELVAKR